MIHVGGAERTVGISVTVGLRHVAALNKIKTERGRGASQVVRDALDLYLGSTGMGVFPLLGKEVIQGGKPAISDMPANADIAETESR